MDMDGDWYTYLIYAPFEALEIRLTLIPGADRRIGGF